MNLREYTLLAVELDHVFSLVHSSGLISKEMWPVLDAHLHEFLLRKLGEPWYKRFRKMWADAAADSHASVPESTIRKQSVFELIMAMPGFHTMGLMCILALSAPRLKGV